MKQNRDLTNRNWIGGTTVWTSGPGAAKSISIKRPWMYIQQVCEEGCWTYLGRSAPCPHGGLRRPQGKLTAVQKSAEGIVGVETSWVEVRPRGLTH